ncbi:MAG: hypothetical protein ABSG78_13105, partial [Verrucomicrobiota bacterium]
MLSLLFFTAGLCLWQAGDRLAASRRALAPASVPSVPSVPSVLSVPSAPSLAVAPAVAAPAGTPPPPSYVLRNTPATAAQLLRNPHGLVLRNALIDTALPVRLAIPE